jgi:hypothetical protein
VQILLTGWTETKRWADFANPGSQADGSFLGITDDFKGMANGYPGGKFFDPLGLSRGSESQLRRYQDSEIKNGARSARPGRPGRCSCALGALHGKVGRAPFWQRKPERSTSVASQAPSCCAHRRHVWSKGLAWMHGCVACEVAVCMPNGGSWQGMKCDTVFVASRTASEYTIRTGGVLAVCCFDLPLARCAGRLAMVAFLGFIAQHIATGKVRALPASSTCLSERLLSNCDRSAIVLAAPQQEQGEGRCQRSLLQLTRGAVVSGELS